MNKSHYTSSVEKRRKVLSANKRIIKEMVGNDITPNKK